MIQSISFNGREACLEPAKKAAKKTVQILGKEPTGDVATKITKTVEEAKDKVRATDVQSYLASHGNIQKEIPASKVTEAYEAVQGIPLN